MYFASQHILDAIKLICGGFFFDIYNEEEVALLIKYDASIITSIMQGCPIEIILRNPKITNRSTKLYIKDNEKNPLWIIWQNFSVEDNNYKGFDEIIIRLIKSDKIKIVLYNELNYPIFTRTISKRNQLPEFDKWYQKIMNSSEDYSDSINDIDYLLENNNNGFKIKVENNSNSNDESLLLLLSFEASKWGGNLINGESHFKIDEYISDGKHGYNQEFSVRSILNQGFRENEELFYSPQKTNDEELTDFLILNNNLAILIESKYVISKKTNKLNQALTKATDQLIKAEGIIWDNIDEVKNKRLRYHLSECKIIFRICVYNDRIVLNDRVCRNIIEKYDKEDLPIFISVRILSEFVTIINNLYKDNFSFYFIDSLGQKYYDFLDSDDEIMIVGGVGDEKSNEKSMLPNLFE